MIGPIKYKSGYKHQLVDDFIVQTKIIGQAAKIDFAELSNDGLLTVKKGYAWDGASGPTYDPPSAFRGSCAHDALYQMIRARKLGEDARSIADGLAYALWRNDGMWPLRAKVWLYSIKKFAAYAAKPENERKIEVFP